MTKDEFIKEINSKLKLVRAEYNLTQDKMAVILGISKKSLVESEKGRRNIGWTEAVALATIFADSTVLQNSFGGDSSEIIRSLAFDDVEVTYPSTMGGKVWWNDVAAKGDYRIQRNMISGHYRLLDKNDCRLKSSFKLEEIEEYLGGLL